MGMAVRADASSMRITYHQPSLEDGAEVWRFVRQAGSLDLNSAYCYIMLCDFNSDTCVIARDEKGEVVGFVSGLVLLNRRDTLFVWQIAVREDCRGLGVGTAMLDALLARSACREVRYIEATIAPSNQASRRLFGRLAERLGACVQELKGYEREDFPEEHEDERLYRIGPLRIGSANQIYTRSN